MFQYNLPTRGKGCWPNEFDPTTATHPLDRGKSQTVIASEVAIDLPAPDGDRLGEVVANAGGMGKDGITGLASGFPFDDDGTQDAGAVLILFLKNKYETIDIHSISET